jgi:hypothetical protein
MRKSVWIAAAVVVVGVLGSATYALAHGGGKDVKHAQLTGYNETPTLSTDSSGSFTARIDDKKQTVEYTLSYSGLEGDVQQAHIHIGRPAIAGGIMAWLCQTATRVSPTPGTPTCPQSGTVTGTLTPASILAVTAQDVPAGGWDEFVAAIRNSAAYANVHTSKYPAGEIRAPLSVGGEHGHDH